MSNTIIDEFKDGFSIEKLYTENRASFLKFGSKYKLPGSVLLDIYQDAIIAYIENARKGHLAHLKADAKTYLFSIGKYLIYKQIKEDSKFENDQLPAEISYFEIDTDHENYTKIEHALNKLGAQCQQILRLFYYEEKKLDDIQTLLQYDSKDVLKSQKSRCLKQLKTVIQ